MEVQGAHVDASALMNGIFRSATQIHFQSACFLTPIKGDMGVFFAWNIVHHTFSLGAN